MTKLVNRAKMTTATTGTGTITLGSAVDGYQTFAAAGVADADVVRYVIEDGDAWEIGLGTYTASGTTLTRGSIESSNSDNALNLSGDAVVYVSAAAADLQELVDFADNFVLPTSDGSTGQVLQTDGAGTLSFTTISGYTDSDVDTHLNTSTASSGEVLSWNGSDYDWVAVSGGATDIDGLSDGYSDGSSVGLGSGALANDDGTTNQNTALGVDAGSSITSSFGNTFVGKSAGSNITTGIQNIAIGQLALQGSGGSQNISVGLYSGRQMTSGSYNVMVGIDAGENISSASRSIAIGQQALQGDATSNLTADDNIGIGYQTGFDLSTGANNFLGGYQAGANLTTGSNNVALGNGAGDTLTTGGNNIVLGNGSDPSSATVSNEITLGNSSITTLRCQVTTITSLSDARDKTDIQPINAGLEFVEALTPVAFTWNMRDGGKVGQADTGFIAQDLQAAQADTGVTIPGLVFDENPEKLEAGYGKLIPVLVQAIKDLSAEVKDLKAQLEAK